MCYTMSEIVTPKNILEDLLQDLSHKPNVRSLQRWGDRIMYATLGSFVSTVTIAVVLKFLGITHPWIAAVLKLLILAVAWVGVLLPLILAISGLLKLLRHPE